MKSSSGEMLTEQVAQRTSAFHRGFRAFERLWRRDVRATWRQSRALILLAVGISAIVLGTIGYLQLTTAKYGFMDSLYRAVTLFGLGGTVTPPVPTTLQIARILAPIITGYAAIGTILVLSREQARVLGIRLFVREHVIIAGLGATGSRLALALVDNEPVVVLEANPANERLATARVRGVRVLIGEATDAVMLRRAGMRHARALVICCGNDGANVDVAAAAADLQKANHRHPVTVFAHLDDQDLWTSLAAEGASFSPNTSGMRLEYFNVLAIGTQLLLEKHPPFRPDDAGGAIPSEPHILIVGLEGIGEQLVLQITRRWIGLDSNGRGKLRITLAGPTAHKDLKGLLNRYRALDQYCILDARAMAIDSADYQSGAAMLGADGKCDITHAYVCLTTEGRALLAALALHTLPDTAHIPVTVPVADHDAGIAIVLESDVGRFHNIDAFGVLSNATSGELLLRGTNELLARAQHDQWLRTESARSMPPIDNPYYKPWDKLSEEQREVNRKFADDLHDKLELVGAMLVPMPLPEPSEPLFCFSGDELEQLAVHEHHRWMQDKIDSGWTWGKTKDDDAKVHPLLVSWDKLPKREREKDCAAVRELPQTLAKAGFGIRKRPSADTAAIETSPPAGSGASPGARAA